MNKLNIGCGYEKKGGYIDISKDVNPDMVVDIEKGLPFPDNHFSYIYSHHCLEHIRPEHWKFVLNEIARVSKSGCILELSLPFDNIATRNHFDHYRCFNYCSFDQLIDDDLRDYYIDLRLERVNPKPNKLIRVFFNLFSFFKHNIDFKFKVIKE